MEALMVGELAVCEDKGCLGEGLFLGWSFEKALFHFV